MVSLTQPMDSHNNKRVSRKNSDIKAPLPRWQLKLNTSLDVRDVLTTFLTGISSLVTCANLRYHNPLKKIVIELGGAKQHSAQYGLKAAGYDLGEITFTRSEPFTEDELKQLEDGLSILFLPSSERAPLQRSVRQLLTRSTDRIIESGGI